MGGPENGNLPLLYVEKMSLRRWVGGSKNLKTTLRNRKMAPYLAFPNERLCSWDPAPVLYTVVL